MRFLGFRAERSVTILVSTVILANAAKLTKADRAGFGRSAIRIVRLRQFTALETRTEGLSTNADINEIGHLLSMPILASTVTVLHDGTLPVCVKDPSGAAVPASSVTDYARAAQL